MALARRPSILSSSCSGASTTASSDAGLCDEGGGSNFFGEDIAEFADSAVVDGVDVFADPSLCNTGQSKPTA